MDYLGPKVRVGTDAKQVQRAVVKGNSMLTTMLVQRMDSAALVVVPVEILVESELEAVDRLAGVHVALVGVQADLLVGLANIQVPVVHIEAETVDRLAGFRVTLVGIQAEQLDVQEGIPVAVVCILAGKVRADAPGPMRVAVGEGAQNLALTKGEHSDVGRVRKVLQLGWRQVGLRDHPDKA